MRKQVIELSNKQIESLIVKAADNFAYPPTPDIAGAVRQHITPRRRQITVQTPHLAWATLIVLFILGGLLVVPQVRATVLEFLQLGAVRIFLTQPTPTPTISPPTASMATPPTVAPRPSSTLITSLLNLAGGTTLAEAQSQIDFPIRTPSAPADLGPPDHVFLQDLGGPAVILVWLEANQPNQVRLSLHQLGANVFVEKVQPQVIQETEVHGERALWTEGPYLLQFQNGGYNTRRLVEGHVLIWQEGGITYRLESNLSLEEVVRIAESLK